MSAPEDPEHHDDHDHHDDRRNWIVLGAAVVIVLIGWLLLHLWENQVQTQNCILEGHRDCVPIPDNGNGQ